MSTSEPAAVVSLERGQRGELTEPAAPALAPDRRRSGTSNLSAELVALYVVLALLGVVMVFPFAWMLATSFKQPSDIYTLSLLPTHVTFDNYVTALTGFPFARWFGNSLLVAGATTASVAFFDSLAGYVLAKLDFPFKGLVFVAILSTLMVPTEMLVIPWYIMSVEYQWTDTYWGIMFPGVISAFGVFLMRQFMHSVPNELLDAGRIDGLGEFGLFWRIALPLVRPALAALCGFMYVLLMRPHFQQEVLYAATLIVLGLAIYFVRARARGEWPFGPVPERLHDD